MEASEKKLAAAMAAVATYIKTEQEAAALAASGIPLSEEPAPMAQASVNMWGLSGRQSMMQMRNLMQMKAFNRL
jgi:hypothetical protein